MISRRVVLAGPIALAVTGLGSVAAAQSPGTPGPAPSGGLEAALALEHEAIHTVPAVAARLSPAGRELGREVDAYHRLHRDRVEAALRAAGRTPPIALPAYTLPRPVVDRASAFGALVLIEEALMRAYASAVEAEPAIHRRLAAELLARCATHLTSWRYAETRALADTSQPFPSRG